jgi:hypothetical protein
MSNPNWNKQKNMNAGRPQADRALESNPAAIPVTEDELEAYRFRGTPIRRTASLVVPQPLPVSHPNNDSHAAGT